MTSPWAAILVALFVWWASTGVILWRVRWADNAGGDHHIWSVLLGLPLLLGGLYGVGLSLDDPSVTGTYIAFASALAVWGWIELAFLSGIITGPNRSPCPPFASGWSRFTRAIGTIAWHEAALILVLAVLWHLSRGADHAFAFWTFGVLFFARISAKLNLFFGVPKINIDFLPSPLRHLPSHFRNARMNWIFPVSVTALCLATAHWLERLHAAATPGATIGFSLLATLSLLALLEHWFMVLPLPDERLWRWMIPDAKHRPTDLIRKGRLREDANGL
jgi:putative photosynthetic complex assembly protein 2